MAKTTQTKNLEKMLWKKLILDKKGIYGCFEVTLGNRDIYNNLGVAEIVDFITYDNTNTVRCYEIKVTKSDFNSSAKVSFYGHYNYYVMPHELYEELKDKIPYQIGVIDETGTVVKNARKKQIAFYIQSMIIESMMKSLHREQTKLYKQKGYWE